VIKQEDKFLTCCMQNCCVIPAIWTLWSSSRPNVCQVWGTYTSFTPAPSKCTPGLCFSLFLSVFL